MSVGQPTWPKHANRSNPLQRLLSHGLFAFGAMAAVLGAMALGYAATLAPVTIVVDGQPRVVHTSQHTVENVLREAGLTLAPEDLVVPNLSAAPTGNPATITLQHARAVAVIADGSTRHFRTQPTTPLDMLQQAAVAIGPYDLLTIDGKPVSLNTSTAEVFSRDPIDVTPLTIVIRRAIPITIDMGKNGVRQVETPAKTVGQALAEANVQLYLGDRIQPDLNTPLTPGMHIQVEPSLPVQVEVDGRLIRSRTLHSTVIDVLNDLGVRLIGQDYTRPALDASIEADTLIRVMRVREEFLIEQEPILFETQQVFDPELELDTSTTRDGKNGVRQKRIRVRYENGEEVARQVEDDLVLQPPVNRVTRYGTQVVVRTLDTPNGPIEYWRHLRAYATSYSALTSGTPASASWYGRTATGARMQKGIIAVDPAVIALGTKVYVPGYGVGAALDTGSGVRGRWLDLGYDDDNLVGWYWWVDAYLLTPVPPANRIPYVLPNWPTYPGR
jgi:uncharacterized protein YabE (DUF348 family)